MKTFRLDEANALLPTVTRLVREMLDARREAAVALLELDALRRDSSSASGRQAVLAEHVASLQERVIARIEKIQALGCVVKDLDLGLVDFPSRNGSEIINLCWKLGEPSIEFWHGVDEGFAARKRIPRLA